MRRSTICTLTIFILFCLVLPSHALFDSDVKKAKEFMAAGMYPQAIELLNKRIGDKPTDAEAHYQLGICYINTGNINSASERFASAVRLETDYGYKIGGDYKRIGDNVLKNGNPNKAMDLYEKAIQYQPNLKADVAQQCFAAGKNYLDQKNSNVADSLFMMSVKYNGTLQENVRKATQEYGKSLLEIAESKPKNERKRYIQEASKYLPQEHIDKAFPRGWETVYKKAFVGVGKTGGDDPDNDGALYTAKMGEDIFVGDRVTVGTKGVEVWKNAKWNLVEPGKWITVDRIKPGGHMAMRAPKGDTFSVVVQRYITNY